MEAAENHHGLEQRIYGNLFFQLGLIGEEIYQEIQKRKPKEWTEEFAEKVYKQVEKYHYFITNLGKCTQVDARPLSNAIYKEYLELFYEEIAIIKPKKIITFGNQVSSLFLQQPICVSKCRRKEYRQVIDGKVYAVYPTYYPIGNGMRNMDKAIEDIKEIMNKKDEK